MMIMQTTKNKFGWPDLRMEHSSCLGSCLLFILIQLYLLSRGLSTSMNSLNVKLVDLFLSIHLWFYLILLLEYVCPVLIQKVLLIWNYSNVSPIGSMVLQNYFSSWDYLFPDLFVCVSYWLLLRAQLCCLADIRYLVNCPLLETFSNG
jgi:hypothetical protein